MGSSAERRLHRAAVIDDAVHRHRAKRARKHGYIPTVVPYAGYGTPGWARVLGRVVLVKPPRRGASAEELQQQREARVRGWRSFTSVPIDDVPVVAVIDGVEHVLHPDRGGIIDEVVPVDLEPGRHDIQLRPHGSDTVSVAPVLIIGDDIDFGLVSDVDDTVMVTALPRPLLAAWNTFVLDEHARMPTPGMAVMYERVMAQHPRCPVIYLSTGPWNVAPTLRRFLSRNLFPAGPLLLTDWGPTHDRFFRSGRQHKENNLQRLAIEFPRIKWLLVGDDGQHDEEIYAKFIADHPHNVVAVAIRQLSASEAVLAGGRSQAEKHSELSGVPWVYAPDGARLLQQLKALGIVAGRGVSGELKPRDTKPGRTDSGDGVAPGDVDRPRR